MQKDEKVGKLFHTESLRKKERDREREVGGFDDGLWKGGVALTLIFLASLQDGMENRKGNCRYINGWKSGKQEKEGLVG